MKKTLKKTSIILAAAAMLTLGSAVSIGTVASAAEATTTVTCPCGLQNCPNNGIPKRDGTGYKGGQKANAANKNTANCPNNGVPKRDGTGKKQGRKNGQKAGKNQRNQKNGQGCRGLCR